MSARVCRSGSTARQRARNPSVAGTRSGTKMVGMPAASAAAAPTGESSTARQSRGSTPSARAAAMNVRRGFSVGHVVPREQGGDAWAQSGGVQPGGGGPRRGGCGDTDSDALIGEHREQRGGSGFQRDAERHVALTLSPVAPHKGRDIEGGAEQRGEDGQARGTGKADQATIVALSDIAVMRAECREERGAIGPLGVEQRLVQVEDDRRRVTRPHRRSVPCNSGTQGAEIG